MSPHQAVIDRHFEEHKFFWKSVYEERELGALIIQQRHERALQWAAELGLPSNDVAIDAGCGAGLMSVGLARLGLRVHAIDHVPGMLAMARTAAEQAGISARVYPTQADVCSLTPFPHNHFSLAVSLGVIAWLDSPLRAVEEMHRILRPGGHLILSVGNFWALSDCLNPPYNPLLAPLRRKAVAHLRRRGLMAQLTRSSNSTPVDKHRRAAEVDQLLRAAGFRKVKSTSIGFGPFRFFKTNLFPHHISLKINETLQKVADRNCPLLQSMGAHYLVLARKTI